MLGLQDVVTDTRSSPPLWENSQAVMTNGAFIHFDGALRGGQVAIGVLIRDFASVVMLGLLGFQLCVCP